MSDLTREVNYRQVCLSDGGRPENPEENHRPVTSKSRLKQHSHLSNLTQPSFYLFFLPQNTRIDLAVFLFNHHYNSHGSYTTSHIFHRKISNTANHLNRIIHCRNTLEMIVFNEGAYKRYPDHASMWKSTQTRRCL